MSLAPVRAAVLRESVRFERGQLAPAVGLRAAVCVALPLFVGIAGGHPISGVTVAAGALPIGVVALIDPHRTPLRTMLLACVGAALSAFVGQLCGGSPALSVLALGVWGLLAGLLVGLGPVGSVIGVQATLGLIVLGRFPLPPALALRQSGLVLLGGLLQVGVAALARLRDPRAVRRSAVADAYHALALLAVDPAAPWPAAAAAASRARALFPVDLHAAADQALRQLLDEAVGIRLALVALTDARGRLAADLGRHAELATALDDVRRDVGASLDAIATTLGGTASTGPDLQPAVRRVELTATSAAVGPAAAASLRQAPTLLPPLLERLTAAHAVLAVAAAPGRQRVRRPQLPDSRRLPVPLRTLAGLASPGTAAGRHAVRLALLLPATDLLTRLLPFQHGYWAPLTVLVVLRPDYATTVSRGLARIAGTLAGLVLATALLFVAPRAGPVLAVFVLLVGWAAYATFRASYAVYAGFITALVVLLLDVVSRPPLAQTLGDRLLATVVGGAVSIGAYLLWPTWEHRQLPERLAALVEATGRYTSVVLAGYADPTPTDASTAHAAAVQARLARSAVELSVARAASEPTRRIPAAPAALTLRWVDEALTAVHVLAAHLPDEHRPSLPPAWAFREVSDASWPLLAEALRARGPAATELRSAHNRLAGAVPQTGTAPALLVAETAVLAHAADALAAELTNDHLKRG